MKRLSGPLLSRFDLLFILLDTPNADLDYQLSAHIIAMHSNNSPSRQRSLPTHVNVNSTLIGSPHLASKDKTKKMPLSERLKVTPDEKSRCTDYDFPVPTQILRKYISYAKRFCEPKIGDEAALVLREFYLDLRQNNRRSNGCNPITMRQLESLMRLTQVENENVLCCNRGKFKNVY